MRHAIGICAAAAMLAGATDGRAQATAPPLDDLLNTRISTAAKYEQRVTDVPASVTVITAEEIARNGWRTLADVLASVRGIHLTYDRDYTYLGVRGVGLPTDYNNRFLVLLDGQPMLEAVSGSIDVGTALGVDLSTLSRIEFVRGPGSVIYGSGAMFGVINLIPKGEQESSEVALGAGSHGLVDGSARVAQKFGGLSFSLSGAVRRDPGQKLFFPEFETPEQNNGLSVGHDSDHSRNVMATLSGSGFRLLALNSIRTKGIPTASFGTTFNEDEQATDGRTLVALQAERRLSPTGELSFRASYDRFDYHGQYPYGPVMWRDRASSTRSSAELRYVWDAQPNHRVTFGAEYVDNSTAHYRFGTDGNEQTIGAPNSVVSAYAQSEYQPTRALTITAGARYDHYEGVNTSFNPRGALVWHATGRNTFKLLYGRAFRLPSVYELGFADPSQNIIRSSGLGPEKLRQIELALESRLTPAVLATMSLYDEDVFDLIGQRTDPVAGTRQFRNGHKVAAQGVEIQLDYRRNDGVWSYVSYSRQRAVEDHAEMVNSPANLAKAGLSTPTSARFQGAVELQYESGRGTYAGSETKSSLLTNMTFSAAVTGSIRVFLTVKNLFATPYAVPAGLDEVGDTIRQDGRTFAIRVRIGG